MIPTWLVCDTWKDEYKIGWLCTYVYNLLVMTSSCQIKSESLRPDQ